jgi:hypothetical protein
MIFVLASIELPENNGFKKKLISRKFLGPKILKKTPNSEKSREPKIQKFCSFEWHN